MSKKEFEKQLLQDLVSEQEVYDNDDNLIIEVIKDEVYDNSRWSILHELIFHDFRDNKYYRARYQVGATEQQYEAPFEYDSDMINCCEVHQVEKLVKVWEKVPNE